MGEQALPTKSTSHSPVRYNETTQTPLPCSMLPHIADQPDRHVNPDDFDHSDTSSSSTLPFAPRIINGIPTPENRYSYAASLILTESLEHICGGTLIAPDIVLTAGHCSGFFDSIQVGRHDRVNQPALTFDHLVVEEHRAHPDYGNVIMNDFALAKLYGSSSVTPVRINNRRNAPDEDDSLTVMGWGVTSEGMSSTASDVLRSVEVDSLSNEVCEQSSGLYEGDSVSYQGYIMANMMCAKGVDSDACQGDSGGPLVQTTTNGSTEEDVQVGVVSWGLGCALGSFPGVYARISAEYDWISSQVCEMSTNPPAYLGCRKTQTAASILASNISRMNSVVTIAIELDDMPEDTGWVLEEDPGVAAKTASAGRLVRIVGPSQIPFGSYSSPQTVATQLVEVDPNEQYRLTLLDRGGDGLAPPADTGRQSRFRVCYGAVPGPECIAASLDSEMVVCSGDGNFELAKSITCYVRQIETPVPTPRPVLMKPPTFAPFEVPLMLGFTDDDRQRPATPRPTKAPTASPLTDTPTWRPTETPMTVEPTTDSPTVDGTAQPTKFVPTSFLSGTSIGAFVTQTTKSPSSSVVVSSAKEPPAPVELMVSNDLDVGVPVNGNLEVDARSSSAVVYSTTSNFIAMAVASTVFLTTW